MTVVSTAVASSSTTSSAAGSSKSSSHTGLIAGLVIGLAGAGLLLGLILFILRSRRNKRRALDSDSEKKDVEDPPAWSPSQGAKELPSPPSLVKQDPMKNLQSELSDGETPGHEMPGHSEYPTELEGNNTHKK